MISGKRHQHRVYDLTFAVAKQVQSVANQSVAKQSVAKQSIAKQSVAKQSIVSSCNRAKDSPPGVYWICQQLTVLV